MTVFPNLSLNTNRIYTSVKDKSGCQIFFPADTVKDAKAIKKYMENFMDKQPPPLAFNPKEPI